jgi:hypothetical protein
MKISGGGAATPLFETVFAKKRIFCKDPTYEMIEWFYSNENTKDIFYEPIDDRVAVVTITEDRNGYLSEKSITIGQNQKNLIIHNFLFYHPDKYEDY